MIIHNLRIALRNMGKQKMYTAIKIGGFALGIAACMLIALLVRNELSYDTHYKRADRIYRLVGWFDDHGNIRKGTSFQAPMAKVLAQDFPEVEKAGRLMPNNLFGGAGSNQFRRSDQVQNTYEQGFCFADQEILDILEIPMVYGNRATALKEPFSLVISKRKANKYFPGENPVGKVVYLNDNTRMPIRIGGVMENFPATSHLHYDFLISLSGVSFWDGEQDTWEASNYPVYLLVKPGTNIPALEQKTTSGILTKYIEPVLRKSGIADVDQILKSSKLKLQPVKDIHLYSGGIEDYGAQGDIRFVWLFGAIAVFILLIACINFLNLSTARSANRAKEVGLRKVIGSTRDRLVGQFLTESILYSFLSFIIAIVLTYLFLPFLNQVAQKQLTIPWNQWWLAPLLLVGAIIVGMLAGIYPSFYLSAFKPIQVLKGQLKLGSKNAGLRGVLVVFQFTTSVVLLIGTLVIYRQMQFILSKNVGFEKDQVIMIEGTSSLKDQTTVFRDELKRIPQVKNVSISDFLPISGAKRNGNTFWNEGKQSEEMGVFGQNWVVDVDYIPTLGMKILKGRNFSSEMPTDSQAAIINQAMAEKIGYPDPVGKKITNGSFTYTVIGMVEDFNYESLKMKVEPLIMALGNSNDALTVKVSGVNTGKTISSIREIWKHFAPNMTLRYRFMDESFAAMYAEVSRTGQIFTGFSVLAIVVACLGLFALATFMAEQRNKEISIRKVLGASISGLFAMLTGNFIKLIGISLLIAIPLGWWMMQKWLEDFSYRTALTWDLFVIPGASVMVIGLLTICYQAVRAALASPINSLRSE